MKDPADTITTATTAALSRRTVLKKSGAVATGLAAVGALGSLVDPPRVLADNTVTLKYWSMWNLKEPQQIVLQQAITQFEQAYPHIKVNVLWGGRDILTKVHTAIANGSGPDLVDKDAEEIVGALVYTGQATPLDDLISTKIPGEDKTIGQAVPASYLNLLAWQGKRYLIPYEVLSSGIWYNQTQFDALGVRPVSTWSQLFALDNAIKHKGRGTAPFANDGNIGIYNAYWYYWLVERYAGPGAFRQAAGDRSGKAWDHPAFLKAAQDDAAFVASGALMKGYQGSKYPSAQIYWAQGHAAMYLCGTWLPSETLAYSAHGVKYRMFDFPSVPGGHNSVELYLIGWVVPKSAANVDAAKKFIVFAMNKNRLRGIVDVAKNLTPRPDLPAPPVLVDAKRLLESGRPVHRIYDGIQATYPGWWEEVFMPLDDSFFFGKFTAQQFIAQLKSQSISYWQRNP